MRNTRHVTSFYAPPGNIRDGIISLPEDEVRHAARVLRMKAGDVITVVDGAGGWHQAILEQVTKDSATAKITQSRQQVGEPAYHLTIAIGLLKSRNRFEVFLEKAVELGVSVVVPLVSERSQGSSINMRRSESVVLAAMKQSGRSRLPEIRPPASLGDMLGLSGQKFVCHESAATDSTLQGSFQAGSGHRAEPAVTGGRPHPAEAVDKLVIAVGPEGGFSNPEVTEAEAAGAQIISLGERRLRTETAGIAVAVLAAALFDSRK